MGMSYVIEKRAVTYLKLLVVSRLLSMIDFKSTELL